MTRFDMLSSAEPLSVDGTSTSSWTWCSNGNLTVAFFAHGEEADCKPEAVDSAIQLTTKTVPYSYTCFNIADIFGQNQTNGFKPADANYTDSQTNKPVEGNGVAWTLRNKNKFDHKANYTGTWYHQVDAATPDPGKGSRWVFYTYAFSDCQQIAIGSEEDYDANPRFETSCQTEADGQCRNTPKPIRSFAINTAGEYNPAHGGCSKWAELGSSAAFTQASLWKTLMAVLFVTLVW